MPFLKSQHYPRNFDVGSKIVLNVNDSSGFDRFVLANGCKKKNSITC
jgi:hypothetical protein